MHAICLLDRPAAQRACRYAWVCCSPPLLPFLALYWVDFTPRRDAWTLRCSTMPRYAVQQFWHDASGGCAVDSIAGRFTTSPAGSGEVGPRCRCYHTTPRGLRWTHIRMAPHTRTPSRHGTAAGTPDPAYIYGQTTLHTCLPLFLRVDGSRFCCLFDCYAWT